MVPLLLYRTEKACRQIGQHPFRNTLGSNFILFKMKFNFFKLQFNFFKLQFNFFKLKFNFFKLKFSFFKLKFNFFNLQFNFFKLKFNFFKLKLKRCRPTSRGVQAACTCSLYKLYGCFTKFFLSLIYFLTIKWTYFLYTML